MFGDSLWNDEMKVLLAKIIIGVIIALVLGMFAFVFYETPATMIFLVIPAGVWAIAIIAEDNAK